MSGGTYNLRTGAWSGLSAASDRACASFSGSTSSQSSSNDIWLVPGTYTISVSYTLTKGEYVVPFTKTGNVTLVAGKTNNISTTAVGGSASEIVFSVSLTPWSNNAIAMEWDSAINSHPFSVSAVKTVQFAKSNLQYQASTGSWRLAQYPWSYVGNAAGNTTATASRPTDSNWIDLFGWGTSGWDNGNYFYQPYDNSSSQSSPYTSSNGYGYGPTDGSTYTYSLTGNYANADWGVYNTIQSYDGYESYAGTLRTLTNDEWVYLLASRTSPSSKRGYACINGTYGLIIFSDDYSDPSGCPTAEQFETALTTVCTEHDWSYSQEATITQWKLMDVAGAVFLPIAGQRAFDTSVSSINNTGYYWSATSNGSSMAKMLMFYAYGFYDALGSSSKYTGCSVRLVKD